jgi:hypothetical protein
LFRIPKVETVTAVAWSRTDFGYRLFRCLVFLTAIRFVQFFLFKQHSFLPAAAGVAGASFGRTAADRTISGTFTGDGMGDGRRTYCEGRKRAHDDHQIGDDKYKSRYVSGQVAHMVYFVPFNESYPNM